MSWELDVIDANNITGRYATQADVESIAGVENVRIWSNLDNESELSNTVRVGDALQYADAVIDSLMAGGPYAVPVQVEPGETLVRTWAARLAAVWLWRGRMPAAADEQAAGMLALDRITLEEIAQVRRGGRQLRARRAFGAQPAIPNVATE